MGAIFDPQLQYESCGIGAASRNAATKDNKRRPINDGKQMLSCYGHRGKDGAGIMMQLDKKFFRKKLLEEQEIDLGEDFGAGMFFLPEDEEKRKKAIELIEEELKERGMEVAAWRDVPGDDSELSSRSKKEKPRIMQAFIKRPVENMNEKAFEEALTRTAWKISEKARARRDELGVVHTASLSSKKIVYKGLMLSHQVFKFFKDLLDPELDPDWVITHTRFSTNTEPRWELAQPRLIIGHNGEINTIDKNESAMRARRAQLNDLTVPQIAGLVDTGWLDRAIAMQLVFDGISLSEALLYTMPPVRNDIENEYVRALFDRVALSREPYGGPAAVVASDGDMLVAHLDSGGLRPLTFTIDKNDYFVMGSERGLVDIPQDQVKQHGSLRGGEIIVVDFDKKAIQQHEEVVTELSRTSDYGGLVERHTMRLPEEAPTPKASELEEEERLRREKTYGWHKELITEFLIPMARDGKEPTSAMGSTRAIPANSKLYLDIQYYLFQRFAEVTNPPIDPIRERESMSLEVPLGRKPALRDMKRADETPTKQLILDPPVLRPGQLQQGKDVFQANAQDDEQKTVTIDTTFNASEGVEGFKKTLKRIQQQVLDAVRSGAEVVVLSDKALEEGQAIVPMVFAVAAASTILEKNGQGQSASIIAQSGEITNPHAASLLLAAGASAIDPHAAYDHLLHAAAKGGREFKDISPEQVCENFATTLDSGVLKIMSKMGVPDVTSYIGGRLFEALNLTIDDFLEEFFDGVSSPVPAHGTKEIAENYLAFAERAKDKEADHPFLGLFKASSKEGTESHSFSEEIAGPKGTFQKMLREENNQRLADFMIENAGELEAMLTEWANEQMKDVEKEEDAGKEIQLMKKVWRLREAMFETDKEIALKDTMEAISTLTEKERVMLSGGIDNVLGIENKEEKGGFVQLTTGRDRTPPKGAKPDAQDYPVQVFTREEIDSFTMTPAYREFMESVRESRKNDPVSLRDNFVIKSDRQSISLDKTQRLSSVTTHLNSGNMSDGALESNAHEIANIGMNRILGKGGSGEGAEEKHRYGDPVRGSKIKQVASGRFGVDADFLASLGEDGEIEIKIAQGAKPGEGGELPPHKVSVEIAVKRGSIPGVGLISPPPHHDIYSIEDLAQLIYDLKAAGVKTGVKLVATQGVGTISCGVVKALCDAGLTETEVELPDGTVEKKEIAGFVNMAGGSGGTGAAKTSSQQHAGMPPEIGLRDADGSLRSTAMRDLAELKASGAFLTGMDVVKATLMGADVAEFGTAVMMALGCIKADKCNQQCPRWIATKHGKWTGQLNDLERYMLNIGAEIREILADMGYESLDEIRGRMDLLEQRTDIEHARGNLDLSKLKEQPENVPTPEEEKEMYHNVYRFDKERLLPAVGDMREGLVEKPFELKNHDRSVGGDLAIKIAKERLATGADRWDTHPEALRINYTGVAGQSFGVWNTHGMHQHLEGLAQDGVGKGMNGGTLSLQTSHIASYAAEENMIAGNACLYGARGGMAFINGRAGDRFGVRNSGATAVVEGIGDWGASFMTSGTMLNLGTVGKHFGSGMTGGIAFQYDPDGKSFEGRYDAESVVVRSSADKQTEYQEVIKSLLEQHASKTESKKAEAILKNWEQEKDNFKIIIPQGLSKVQEQEHLADIIETFKRRGDMSLGMQAWRSKTQQAIADQPGVGH